MFDGLHSYEIALLAQEIPIDASVSVADPKRRGEIARLIRRLESQPTELTAAARMTLVRGYMAIGDEDEAARNLRRAEALDPDLRIDFRLRHRLTADGRGTGDEG